MIIPEGFGNVRFIFTCTGVDDPMSFSLGFQGDLAWDPGDAADSWYTEFKQRFCPAPESFYAGWTFVGTSVTKTVAGDPVVAEHIQPFSGSAAVATAMVNSAVLVRKNTAAGGRKNRGRMFIPPFNLEEGSVTAGGTLTPAYVTGITGGWVLVLADMAAENYFPWLFHSDPADAATPITSLTCQGLMATQRRRMR